MLTFRWLVVLQRAQSTIFPNPFVVTTVGVWRGVSGQFMDNIDFQYFNAFMLIGLGEHVGN